MVHRAREWDQVDAGDQLTATSHQPPAAGNWKLEDHARRESNGKRENDDARVDHHRIGARQRRSDELHEHWHRERSEHQPCGSSHKREQHAFRKHVTNDAAVAGAERDPDGDVATAAQPAREQEARDVDARDEQHAGDRDKQHQQDCADPLDHDVLRPRHEHRRLVVRLWIRFLEARGNRCDFRPRLID